MTHEIHRVRGHRHQWLMGMGALLLANAVQAAPYVLSFSGEIWLRTVEGQLDIGDPVSGRIYYDTDLLDTDPADYWGQYPGATAEVKVADLEFSLLGAMFTNTDVVIGFSAQTATQGPPSLLEFVEIGFFAEVYPGFGSALPVNTTRFRGTPEVTVNFLSSRDGVVYYDVVTARVTQYSISPVPEPLVLPSALAGLAMVGCWRLGQSLPNRSRV